MKRRSVVFKEQPGHQVVLFPQSVGDRIPEAHPVRLVDRVVDELNIDRIMATYKGAARAVTIPACCSRCSSTLTSKTSTPAAALPAP